MNHSVRKWMCSVLAVCMMLSLAACAPGNQGNKNVSDELVNGDFELVADGKWVGWTRTDAAFNFRGVTNQEKIAGVVMEKSGQYYFSGTAGANPAMRGTLTSDVFKLGGNGFITFKMGGGKNTEKIYVEFFEDGKDEPLARVVNKDCDGVYITEHLLTQVVDLSAYVGKNIYIKVTDNDDGNDMSHVNLDAFKVCTTDEEVAAARAEYARQIEAYGPKPFTEDETSNTIVNGSFETGDLTGWLILDGTAISRAGIVPTSQYYWGDRSVYGHGEYYFDGNNNGVIQESLTGAIRSTKFTLGGDGFISFMIGSGNGGSYVALCDGNTDEELIKVHNDYFSDPALALTLLRVYVDASEYLGRVVYLKVVDANDGSKGGFAFINVDDFRVSMTKEEVGALEVEQMEAIRNETYTSASYNDLQSLLNYYSNYPYPVPLAALTMTGYVENQAVDCGTVNLNDYLKDASAAYGNEAVTNFVITKVTFNGTEIIGDFNAFDMSQAGNYQVTYAASYQDKTVEATFTVTALADNKNIANGDFETGDLTGWTVLNDNWSIVEGKPAGVISAETYWGENLPYNQGGSFHLDGWNTGIAEPEGWRVRSTTFTLSGSGFISARMGGAAAVVRVYLADGTEIGVYKQNRFADVSFPNVGVGNGSWADMGTYVMDLSAYIGQDLYIELCDDVIEGGWAHAFFDEIVTYYETAPDYANLYDTVKQSVTGEDVQLPWQLAVNALTGMTGNKTIANGDFETGDLTGWTVLNDNWSIVEGKPAGVISAETYWGENLPYNQGGSFHLDGWSNGIAEPEGWRVRSTTFTLSGSGFISARMGGAAAVMRVYLADGTEIGVYKQNRFADVNFPNVGVGNGSWADMGTYVMDLSAYIGQDLYIELCDDVIEGGWAQAFFDEIVTYYETAPDYANLYDTVKQSVTGEDVQLPWQLAVNQK